MLSLGIDIGYSAIKVVATNAHGNIHYAQYKLHKGNVGTTLKSLLEELPEESITHGAVTGSGKNMFSDETIAQVNEVASIVEGSLHLAPTCASIVEIGGQSAKFITGFSVNDKSRVQVSMNSNCSSGTGSFLEEQTSRLNLKIGKYAEIAAKATHIPRIAGRCSVFAKTDIIHHQQEGVPVADILLGLAHAVTQNYRNAVMRGMDSPCPILFVGGVSQNKIISETLQKILKLKKEELLRVKHGESCAAVGASLMARQQNSELNLKTLMDSLDMAASMPLLEDRNIRLQPLYNFGRGDAEEKHQCATYSSTDFTECWLGIDVGSTSTNLVLTNSENKILGYRYLRTAGNPVTAVKLGLRELQDQFQDTVRIAGVGTTGSGRYMIGRLVGADVVRDEITAQAKGARTLVPTVDTVMEIGGQDSKFIAMDNGVVTDFQMNKICAAGTGSFIEEQAKKLGIELSQFGEIVFESEAPISLGERCTVFMETSIAAHLAHGAAVEDLASGLCYSIVKNYLNRVVGQKRIGNTILFQGGVAHNQGVVNALRATLGKEVIVPPFFSVTGAFGAAVLAREEMDTGPTVSKGFQLQPHEMEQCPESSHSPEGSDFNQDLQEFIFEGYTKNLDPNKKTIGIPRTLFTYGMFPMFYPFFKELGLNVLLSKPTSEETVRRAQEYSLDETCYPVKLVNGHVAELVDKNVDYLFFPDLYTVFHPRSQARQNYGCAYMQLAFKIINKAMRLKEKGVELLAPTFAFSLGQDFMRSMFMNMGARLGCTKEQTALALQKGMQSYHGFEKRIEQRSTKAMATLDPRKKTFVLISKIYGVADPALNLGIADRLRELGYQALPFFDVPEADIFKEYPNMYWPFGQHILEAAKLVRHHPNLHAVFLTHHGCGPDTVLSHYFKDIMKDKPYLTIEVDEHSSAVGVITRVEAFVNSLGNTNDDTCPAPATPPVGPQVAISSAQSFSIEDKDHTTLLLPRLYPYSEILCERLQTEGYKASPLPQTTSSSIETGRKHTVANEYFSMTALLGDMLEATRYMNPEEHPVLVLPQSEGAEVDAQYSRFLRTKLDQQGLNNIQMFSPFLEDIPEMDEQWALPLQCCLLAGDLVLQAKPSNRDTMLERTLAMVRANALDLNVLSALADEIYAQHASEPAAKRLFSIGEPLVLYNPTLNDHTFERLEAQGYEVVFAPLGECLFHFWNDHFEEQKDKRTPKSQRFLSHLQYGIEVLSERLKEASPYAANQKQLEEKASSLLGHYAGAFGRYRAAKAHNCPKGIDGVITATSMYENTGISLGILHKGNGNGTKPLLSLTFDGNRNENEVMKTESFIHYL